MFLWWDLHIKPQSLNLVVSKSLNQFLLLSFFPICFSFFPLLHFLSIWSPYSFYLSFCRHLADGNIPELLFFYKSLRNSLFHIRNGVTLPQAVLQEGLKPQNVWEFFEEKGRARGIHFCSPWILCPAMGVFMEISTKDTFKLEARHAGVMDSLVACKHSSESRQNCTIPTRTVTVVCAPESYSAFQTSELQRGSAAYQCLFMMHIIHTPIIAKDEKE